MCAHCTAGRYACKCAFQCAPLDPYTLEMAIGPRDERVNGLANEIVTEYLYRPAIDVQCGYKFNYKLCKCQAIWGDKILLNEF